MCSKVCLICLYRLSTCDNIVTGVYVGGVLYLSLATWAHALWKIESLCSSYYY